jgi:hypothetical protein
LINSISLQEAKSSSEIENIFTTDDELYKAYSDNQPELTGSVKKVLRYRGAFWAGFAYVQETKNFDLNYFIKQFQIVKQTEDSIRPEFLNTSIKQGGSGPNEGKKIYTPQKNFGYQRKT